MFVIGYHQNESSQQHTQNLTIERQNSYYRHSLHKKDSCQSESISFRNLGSLANSIIPPIPGSLVMRSSTENSPERMDEGYFQNVECRDSYFCLRRHSWLSTALFRSKRFFNYIHSWEGSPHSPTLRIGIGKIMGRLREYLKHDRRYLQYHQLFLVFILPAAFKTQV